jgi:hypothetical protein
MKTTIFSTLIVALSALLFSACSNSANISNNSAANNANKPNTNIVVNATPVSNTTPATNKNSNANKSSNAKTSANQSEATTVSGELQTGKTESVILYVGEESGDYAAYCFANDSDAGKAILAACKNKDQCEVAGEVESGGCKVPGLEADLSDSGRIVKVTSVKKLPAKK